MFFRAVAFAGLLLSMQLQLVASDTRDEPAFASAIAALNEGDTASAVQKFRALVEQHPADLQARVGLIAAYLKTGRSSVIEQQINQALSVPEPDFAVLMHLESMLVGAGRFQDALKTAKAAEPRAPPTIDGQDRSAYFQKLFAALYSESQRMDDAIHTLEQAIRQQPDTQENYYQLVLLLIRNGQMTNAFALAGQAMARFPESSQVLLSYALACFFSGHNEEAENAYRTLVRIEPDSDEAHFALGNYYDDVKRPAEAAQEFEMAATKNPHNYLNFYMYGVASFKLNKLTAASAALRQALSLNSQHADSWYWLGRIDLRSGKKQEAFEDFRKVIALQPRHLAAHYQLALLYAQRGEPDKSKEMFRQWRELNGLAEHNVVAERMP